MMQNATIYLKWEDDMIGVVSPCGCVSLLKNLYAACMELLY